MTAEAQKDGGKKGLSTTLITLGMVAVAKFKSVLWMLGSLGTMIASIWIFSLQFGLPYALSLVMLIYIHEAGHWIWMKALGLEPKAPMFIPGLGAFVAMKKLPSSEAIHAWVALAGPLIGGLGCAVLYAIGVHTHNDWLAASGNTGFFLNLLQMIPAKPFDGGFAIGSISRWLLVPGTILLFALGLLTGSAILLILAIISLFSWKRPSKSKKDTQVGTIADGNNTATDGTNVDDPSLCAPAATWERFAIGFAYLSLIGALAVGYLISFDHVDTLIKK